MLRRTLPALAVAAALVAAGCGATESQTAATPTQQTGAAVPQATPGSGPAGSLGTLDADALATAAKQLGVSTAKLRQALEANRPQAGEAPSGSPDAAIAKALGTSETEVREALAGLFGGGRGAPPADLPQGTAPEAGQQRGAEAPATGTAA